MEKYFNVTGICIPEKHYMADISATVREIQRQNYGALRFMRQKRNFND